VKAQPASPEQWQVWRGLNQSAFPQVILYQDGGLYATVRILFRKKSFSQGRRQKPAVRDTIPYGESMLNRITFGEGR
jgi:hypothetical protein